MRKKLALLFLVALTMITGCGAKFNDSIDPINTIYLPNKVVDEIEEKEDTSYIDSYNNYAIDKAVELFSRDQNELFSPMSMYFPTIAYYDGLDEEARKEIGERFFLDEDYVEQYMKIYNDSVYANKKERSVYKNLIFIAGEEDKDLLSEDYMNRLKKFHVGYISHPKEDNEKISEELDKFVSKSTGQTFDKSSLKEDLDRAILSFNEYNGNWKVKKVYERPYGLDFNSLDGKKKTMTAIKGIARTKYSINEDYTSMEMPLEDGFSLLFAMPDDFEKFDLTDKETLKALLKSPSEEGHIVFSLPKFSVKKELDLTDLYSELDMAQIKQYLSFEINKEGIKGYRDMEINAFKTKEKVEDRREIVIDKPFIYALKSPKGEICYLGVYKY